MILLVLIYHQLGLHLTHGGVEVVLDDLADLGRDLRLELLHELGTVVVHIPDQDKMQRRAKEQGEMVMYPKKCKKPERCLRQARIAGVEELLRTAGAVLFGLVRTICCRHQKNNETLQLIFQNAILMKKKQASKLL